MFLLFWSLIWLKKPPSMTFLLSSWPSTSKINTQKLGPALLGFSTFEFLPVLNGEAQVDCYFDVSRIECSCWSSELATSESGWNPWWGGKVQNGLRGKSSVSWHTVFKACKEECMFQWLCGMQHMPNRGLCWWRKIRRQKWELNPCSQRQQKEAQEGAELKIAQRYLIFFFQMCSCSNFWAKWKLGQNRILHVAEVVFYRYIWTQGT